MIPKSEYNELLDDFRKLLKESFGINKAEVMKRWNHEGKHINMMQRNYICGIPNVARKLKDKHKKQFDARDKELKELERLEELKRKNNKKQIRNII